MILILPCAISYTLLSSISNDDDIELIFSSNESCSDCNNDTPKYANSFNLSLPFDDIKFNKSESNDTDIL